MDPTRLIEKASWTAVHKGSVNSDAFVFSKPLARTLSVDQYGISAALSMLARGAPQDGQRLFTSFAFEKLVTDARVDFIIIEAQAPLLLTDTRRGRRAKRVT
jgi:hypothetical protein